MKLIKYTVEVKFMSKQGKEIKLSTHASSERELFDAIKKVLEPKSKWSVITLFDRYI